VGLLRKADFAAYARGGIEVTNHLGLKSVTREYYGIVRPPRTTCLDRLWERKALLGSKQLC